MEGISKAFELVEFVWRNEKTNSYTNVNSLMYHTVEVTIKAHFEFHTEDFRRIYEKFRGGYWFGANLNGKGCGEGFYASAAINKNISACKSFEAFAKIKPFITSKGNRCYTGKSLRDKERRYRVTGFNHENGLMTLVSYELSDWREEGKRKLHNFTNKEWNEFRKQVKEF